MQGGRDRVKQLRRATYSRWLSDHLGLIPNAETNEQRGHMHSVAEKFNQMEMLIFFFSQKLRGELWLSITLTRMHKVLVSMKYTRVIARTFQMLKTDNTWATLVIAWMLLMKRRITTIM
jgi:hypothetical protein